MEEEILKYFNSHPKKRKLSVLDNKYRKFYTGVTLNYITYDLLKAKYRKSDVAEVLLKLFKEEKINSLHCGNVKNYVFEPLNTGHWSFNSKTGTSYGVSQNVITYLNKFIKN